MLRIFCFLIIITMIVTFFSCYPTKDFEHLEHQILLLHEKQVRLEQELSKVNEILSLKHLIENQDGEIEKLIKNIEMEKGEISEYKNQIMRGANTW